jgi:hypothetical protein
MTMTASKKGFQNKPNAGALFRNEQKEKADDRDYSGSIDINGTEYWLSGWIKQSKNSGRKYLSIAAKPKEAASASRPEFNDEISF